MEFKLKAVKSKPVKAVKRARKGANKTEDIKTCYDCPECTLTGEMEEGLKKYKCGFNPTVTKLIAKIMKHCTHMNKPKVKVQDTADYIQEAYREIRERVNDK